MSFMRVLLDPFTQIIKLINCEILFRYISGINLIMLFYLNLVSQCDSNKIQKQLSLQRIAYSSSQYMILVVIRSIIHI
ncbi:hypothetical protein pb186bvf_015291 [Paramecium bursaria]